MIGAVLTDRHTADWLGTDKLTRTCSNMNYSNDNEEYIEAIRNFFTRKQ
jgi:hypothetical protein